MARYLLLSLFLVCGVARAQDLGGRVQVDSYFHSVELNGAIHAVIHPLAQDDTVSRAVITIEGLMVKEVPWKVVKSCLVVDAERGLLERKGSVTVDIYIKDLRELRTKGAAVVATERLATENLTVATQGAANKIRLDVWVKNLIVSVSGDSDVSISGQAEGATLKTLVGSRIDMLHCVARNVYATASESSEIYLYVLDRLEAKVTTCATIYYLTPSADPVLAVKQSLWGAVVPILSPEVTANAR